MNKKKIAGMAVIAIVLIASGFVIAEIVEPPTGNYDKTVGSIEVVSSADPYLKVSGMIIGDANYDNGVYSIPVNVTINRGEGKNREQFVMPTGIMVDEDTNADTFNAEFEKQITDLKNQLESVTEAQWNYVMNPQPPIPVEIDGNIYIVGE